jgi:TatD DNase family protein
MNRLPPIDLHAHIDASIDPDDLLALEAVVFAVTRKLDEAASALDRGDELTVWGVGCHPGLAEAHEQFGRDDFAELLERTAFAGELGLDGKSRVPLDVQSNTLRTALEVLADRPRIVSLHSYAATEPILTELERLPGRGRVLHWWLGDAALTRRAVELGCYFSVPPSAVRRADLIAAIPFDRILTETDHPFGNKRGAGAARPGNVVSVEHALAAHHQLTLEQLRLAMWRNLNRLVREVGCGRLLPTRVRILLAALPPEDQRA